jgi:hypothetical protein
LNAQSASTLGWREDYIYSASSIQILSIVPFCSICFQHLAIYQYFCFDSLREAFKYGAASSKNIHFFLCPITWWYFHILPISSMSISL